MDKENATTNVRRRSDAGRRKTGHSKSNVRRSALETGGRRPSNSRTGMKNVKLQNGRTVRTGVSRTNSSKTSRKVRSRLKLPNIRIPGRYTAGGAALIILLIVIIFAVKGCGVNHKTPDGVVRNLIEAYDKGKESRIRNCYGVKKADDNLQQEIDATVKYFQAHNPQSIEISQCDSIYKDGNYTYMYITYNLVLDNNQSYPCISTYMVQKKDNNKYYVLSTSEITDDMSKQAATKYALFMKTDAYKQYATDYDKFIKKNPGYEEKIASKLK
nr:hypothetical protein [uncultured Blautia sp.]